MNPHDYPRLDDGVGDDVRSAFDEMFDEAGIGLDRQSEPPPLGLPVGVRRLTPAPKRLPLTRAAASVAVLAVGVLIAVAVRSGQGSTPGGGTPIDTVDATTMSGAVSNPAPTSADPDPSATLVPPDTATVPESSSPPATAAVVTIREPALWIYDVVTGAVIDRVEHWGTPSASWSDPYSPPGSDRAYLTQSSHRPSDQCAFRTGKILTTPWPDPPVGADGLPQVDEYADFGGFVFEFSADGSTMLYDVYPGCSAQPDGGWKIGFRESLRLVNLVTGEEMTVSTRVGVDRFNGGILDAALTPEGELVVMLGPAAEVYRLTPTDGAIIEDSGTLVADASQWQGIETSPPRLLSADASSVTVSALTSVDELTVVRGPNADGTWTELVKIQGGGSVDADAYGNLIVAARPEAKVTTAPGASIPILRTPEILDPWVQW